MVAEVSLGVVNIIPFGLGDDRWGKGECVFIYIHSLSITYKTDEQKGVNTHGMLELRPPKGVIHSFIINMI